MLNRLIRSITTVFYREQVEEQSEHISFEVELSKETARKRLQQVLVQDRMSGGETDLLDAMKTDLVAAISKHLRIERESVEMQVRRNGDLVVLKGNVRLV